MSVVLSCADENIAIIASDGRVTDKELNIVHEDYNKTVRVNDRTIMGFSGNFARCQNIVKLIQNPENKNFVQTLYPEDIALFVEKMLSDEPLETLCNFIICGINKNKKICSAHVQSRQKAIITHPEAGKICFDGAYPHVL